MRIQQKPGALHLTPLGRPVQRRRPEFGRVLDIGPRGDELHGASGPAMFTGRAERRRGIVRLRVRLGIRCEERLDALAVTAVGSNVERPQALCGLQLQVGAAVDKQPRALRVALPAGNVQRGTLLRVELVQRMQLGRCQQEHHAAAVATKACDMQRRAAGGDVAQVGIGAAVQQQPRCVGPAALTCKEQRRVAIRVCCINIMASFIQELPDPLEVSRRQRAAD